MLSGWTALVGLLLVVDPGPPSACPPTEFEGWFRAAGRGELEVPASVARKAAGFRYVFVGGFRNERIPGYFAQNMAELRAHGVPEGAIHVIHPSSSRTSEQNVEEVRARFLEVARGGTGRLVVIGHSRGACDALAFAVADPGFVRDHVEALYLIQGPFGGSDAADYAVGRGPAMDRRMPLRHRVVCHLAGRAVRAMARGAGLEVLEGMTRRASLAFWEKALAEHAGAVATVGPRTFYVRSQVEPSRLRFVRRAIAWYLRTYHGPSDGLVALADQCLPALGTVVATLEAGHADLTQRFPATRAPRSMRRALVRSILMAVGRPDPAPVAAVPDPTPPASAPLRPAPGGVPKPYGPTPAEAAATASTTVR